MSNIDEIQVKLKAKPILLKALYFIPSFGVFVMDIIFNVWSHYEILQSPWIKATVVLCFQNFIIFQLIHVFTKTLIEKWRRIHRGVFDKNLIDVNHIVVKHSRRSLRSNLGPNWLATINVVVQRHKEVILIRNSSRSPNRIC